MAYPFGIGDRLTPLQELEDGDLTEIAFDNMINVAEQGMSGWGSHQNECGCARRGRAPSVAAFG
ncbi:hypothetical protein ACLBYD_26200 [Rhodococcus sp. C26F]